jgi:hypothetical protein
MNSPESVDIVALKSHMERRIMETELLMSPFPHMLIENFFPKELYRDILQFNLFKANEGTPWATKQHSRTVKTKTPYYLRHQINFHQKEKFETPDESVRQFWNDIRQTFLSDDWFPKLVFKRFPEYFRIRFGDAVDDDQFWNRLKKQLFLQRHQSDYFIGPHTDVGTRIFTCIFAFAEVDGFEEYGTQLLKPKDPFTRCSGDTHHDFDNFDVVKTAPYKPNNLLLFFKTRQSFHSVKKLDEQVPNGRYGMQFQFYEPGGGVFKDLSKPNLLKTNHHNLLGKTLKLLARR